MKNLKKAIAVMLAVLMVAFCMPFNAMALGAQKTDGPNPDNDVVVKLYFMPYTSDTAYGYSDSSTAKILDPTNLSFDDLGSNHQMVLYVVVENLDSFNNMNLTWNFDTSVIQANSVLLKPSTLDALKTYITSADEMTDVYEDSVQVSNTEIASAIDTSNITSTAFTAGTFDGMVVGAFCLTLLQDNADVTWYYDDGSELGFDLSYNTYIIVDGDTDNDLYPQGNAELNGEINTEFAVEYAAPSAPQPSGVTYTFIDNTSTTVTDGTTPANTATTAWTDNGNGTHSQTSYSWVKDSDTAYHEVGTTDTQNCNSATEVSAQVDPIHTQDSLVNGTTAVTKCSVCGGNQQGGEPIVAAHTYNNAGAVTAVAATCTVAAHNHYVCDVCGLETDGDYTGTAAGHTYEYSWNWAADYSTATCTRTCTNAAHNAAVDGAAATTTDPIASTTSETTQGGKLGTLYTVTTNEFGEAQSDTRFVAYGKITVNYVNAAGQTVDTQEIEVGQTPANPAENTATAYVSNGNGTHQKTVYSWPAATPVAQTPAVVTINEASETTTENCSMTETAAAITATCKTEGYTAAEACDYCTYVVEAQNIGLDPANHEDAEPTVDPAVAATCCNTGLTEGSHWACCGLVVTAQTETGLNPDNHEQAGTPVEGKEATRGEDGYTAYTHYDCCGIDVGKEIIPATGVIITVNTSDLGAVAVNGAAYEGPAKVAYGQTYTLNATANGNAKFVAWMVGDKIVSTSAEYKTAAFADTTYTAVFEDPSAATFDITFVDKFNNVIATYSSTDVASWDAIPEIASPFDGYTITGYDKTLDQIKAATEAMTVTANYEKAEKTFTVNADGATINVAGVDYQNTATVTGYDVPVTVTADGATAWTVNGKVAGYGASYQFYVTSDVTITFDTAVADAQPVVTAVNGNGDLQSNGKVRFLASRSVPANYKVVESGFVYGLDVNVDDLTLENVNGNTIKLYKNNNTSNEGQFAVNYNVSAAVATASVRAYLIVSLNGNVQDPIYADAQTYTK